MTCSTAVPAIDTVSSGWYRFDGHGGDEDPAPTVTLDGVANDGRPGENDNVVAVEHIDHRLPAGRVRSGGVRWRRRSPTRSTSCSRMGWCQGAGGDDRRHRERLRRRPSTAAPATTSSPAASATTGSPAVLAPTTSAAIATAACFYGPIYGTCTVGSGNDTIYARDGERDTVDCGPGTDTAWVDAADATTGCETLHVTGGPGAGHAPSKSVAKPSVRIGRQRLRTIAKKRVIRLRCRLARAGRCSIRASIRAADARKLHIKVKRHASSVSLGSRTVKLERAGTATVLFHIRKATAIRLRRARSLRMTFRAIAHYTTGRSTLTRRVRIRR